MNEIKVNIAVTVSLSETTIQALGALLNVSPAQRQAIENYTQKPAPASEVKPVTRKPEVKAETTPVAAEAPESPSITDEELRAVIKECRNNSSPAAVRSLFNEFGIKTSIECPQERRAELVARLKKLAA